MFESPVSNTRRGTFDFLVLVGVCVLFLPFFGSVATIDPVLMPRFFVWSILTFVLFALFLIRLCISPAGIDTGILRRRIFSAFAGFMLFSAISLTKAVNITEGVYEVVKIFVSLVFLFLATVILTANRDHIGILAKAVVISAAVLSLIGFYQYFKHFSHTSGIPNITGPMAQKNQFASALFLMLPFCLYSALTSRLPWKIMSMLSMAGISTMILLNQTRSVWLGIFVSTAVTAAVIVVLIVQGKIRISKARALPVLKLSLPVLLALITAGVVFSALYFRTHSVDSLLARLKSIYSTQDTINAPRLSMWNKTLEPIKDNLIFGIGPGNWKVVIPSYGIADYPRKDMFKNNIFVRPENDYVWVLSETGVAGFAFYLAVFGFTLTYIIRILARQSDAKDKLAAINMLFGIVGYMVISFFTFPKERIFHSMFLLLMIAVVITIYHRSAPGKKNVARSIILLLAVPSIVVLIFAIFLGYVRLKAEIHTKKAFAARKAKVWAAVIHELDQGYSPFATLDPTSTPLYWYRGEANFLLNNTQQAHEDFKKAHYAHPYHIHVLNNLATTYEINGDHENAVRYYKEALRIYPQFEDALINLGATYYNCGKYEEAFRILKQCTRNSANQKLKKTLEAVQKALAGENNSR